MYELNGIYVITKQLYTAVSFIIHVWNGLISFIKSSTIIYCD